jgi:hypothetical protein
VQETKLQGIVVTARLSETNVKEKNLRNQLGWAGWAVWAGGGMCGLQRHTDDIEHLIFTTVQARRQRSSILEYCK